MAALRPLPPHAAYPYDACEIRRGARGGAMTFDHPWALLLALLPLAWVVWEWRLSGRRSGLLLKAGTFLAIALALAMPRIVVYDSKVAVAILADTLSSISI